MSSDIGGFCKILEQVISDSFSSFFGYRFFFQVVSNTIISPKNHLNKGHITTAHFVISSGDYQTWKGLVVFEESIF